MILEERKRLSHLDKASPDIAFRHWLVVPCVKLACLPLRNISERIMLEDHGTVVVVRFHQQVCERTHNPVAIGQQGQCTDFEREHAFCMVRGPDNLFYDKLLAVESVDHERYPRRQLVFLFPVSPPPYESLGRCGD